MDTEITNLLNAHKDTVMFYKYTGGQWAGGDVAEVAKVAIALGFPEYQVNYSCSSCIGNMIMHIFNNLDPKEYEEYKKRKGL
jgi:hypothetical protein